MTWIIDSFDDGPSEIEIDYAQLDPEDVLALAISGDENAIRWLLAHDDELTASGDWDPEKHPRDEKGRFGPGGGDTRPEDWQLASPPKTSLPWQEYEAARTEVKNAQDAYAAAHISEPGRTAFTGNGHEAQALRGYTIGDYHQVNDVLRGRAGSPDDPARNEAFSTVKDQVDALDRGIAQGVVTEDMVVFRGAGGWAASLSQGDVVTDRAFVSTSLSREVAAGFGPVFEISVPAGTHAAFTNENVYKVFHEAEVVLGREQSFRVTGRDGDVIRASLERQ